MRGTKKNRKPVSLLIQHLNNTKHYTQIQYQKKQIEVQENEEDEEHYSIRQSSTGSALSHEEA